MNIKIDNLDASPAYVQIGRELERYIEDAGLSDGDQLPTVQKVADAAGVSLRTAEKGLNELIKAGLCYRRPKRGTFVGKSRLASRIKRKVCGIFHTRGAQAVHTDAMATKFYRGFSWLAHENETDVLMLSAEGINSILPFYLSSTELDFHGIATLHFDAMGEEIRLVQQYPSLRVVHVNYALEHFEETPANIYGVFSDDFAGGYQLGAWLSRRTRGPFGIISLDLSDDNYLLRIRGFREGANDSGINIDERYLRSCPLSLGKSHQQVGAALAREILELRCPPTTFFCVNDLLAEGVLQVLQELGREDIILAGYDNILPQVSQNGNFTTMAINYEEMGRKAAEILLNPDKQYPKTIRLTPQLIPRCNIPDPA